MKKERNNTKTLLIDIQYYDSMNMFEFEFGEYISYKEIEQKSYIEFKDIMFENISKDIKFRKFGRVGKILTIKANMLKHEVEKLKDLMEYDKINIGNGWIVSNITLAKNEKMLEKNNTINVKTKDSEEDDELLYDDLEDNSDEFLDEEINE